ncbi:hypothetical protein Plim_3182 [Planctopirus limnophila DSM 3776]|uniref:Transmembrane protein n=1 Tax=Planctopirus limnophila (strain ATCC 43296 / DSM 3776 / IFAM 1008 / Mu 290) TaxID=521674 RepID=D5STG7_PLAL2|nr:hypothetical protein Plim_3182 [Planctopirus limnophila DSM 3776]
MAELYSREEYTVDSKSAAVLGISFGLTLGGAVVLASYVAAKAQPMAVPRVGTGNSSVIGRYQIAGIPGHAYVLDTATGQVWEDFAPTSEGARDHEFKRVKLK